MDSGKLNVSDESFSRTRFDSFDIQYTGMEQGLALALPTESVDSPVTSDLPAFESMLLPSDVIELQSLGFCDEQVPSSPALSTSSVPPVETETLILPRSVVPAFTVDIQNPGHAFPASTGTVNRAGEFTAGHVKHDNVKQEAEHNGGALSHVISTEQMNRVEPVKHGKTEQHGTGKMPTKKRSATTIYERRERNRIHARMTRMRKKAKLDSLENQNKQLTAENQALKTENYNLRMQLQQLEMRVAASSETDTQLVTDIESPGSESAIN